MISQGNWETVMKLGIPDTSTGKNTTQWAYAPHLSSLSNSVGPLVRPIYELVYGMSESLTAFCRISSQFQLTAKTVPLQSHLYQSKSS